MCKPPDFGALVGTWVIAANAGWLRHPRIAAGREGLVARPCRLAGLICHRFSARDLLCSLPFFHWNACDRSLKYRLISVFPLADEEAILRRLFRRIQDALLLLGLPKADLQIGFVRFQQMRRRPQLSVTMARLWLLSKVVRIRDTTA